MRCPDESRCGQSPGRGGAPEEEWQPGPHDPDTARIREIYAGMSSIACQLIVLRTCPPQLIRLALYGRVGRGGPGVDLGDVDVLDLRLLRRAAERR